jgi:hypothetical protein
VSRLPPKPISHRSSRREEALILQKLISAETQRPQRFGEKFVLPPSSAPLRALCLSAV